MINKKNKCHYCSGYGLSKYWVDTGITNGKGVNDPVRWVNLRPVREAYRCNVCDKPENLPPCPRAFK